MKGVRLGVFLGFGWRHGWESIGRHGGIAWAVFDFSSLLVVIQKGHLRRRR